MDLVYYGLVQYIMYLVQYIMYLVQYIMGCTNHGHGIGGQQLLGRHGGEVGDVGEGVDQRDQRDGDVDGPGQVPVRRGHRSSDY